METSMNISKSPPQVPPHFGFFLRIFLRIPPFKNNPVKNFRIPPLQKRKIGFGGGVFEVKPPYPKYTWNARSERFMTLIVGEIKNFAQVSLY